MKVAENVLLSQLITMRVGGTAKFVITINSKNDLIRAINFTRSEKLPWLVIGEGSNLIADGNYRGVIIQNHIGGFNQIDSDKFRIGAGERWDSVANRMCRMNLSGAELLSGIPGLVGGAIINNISALGQEISAIIAEVTVYNTNTNQFETLSNEDCHFGQRSSIFRQPQNKHLIIIDAIFHMNQRWIRGLNPAIANQIASNNHSPLNIRDAVMRARITRLPDPRVVSSVGQFFKNPSIEPSVASDIRTDYPDMPQWHLPNGQIKVPAAWLIEKSGLRGKGQRGFQIYSRNAGIIINTGGGTANDLAEFSQSVANAVKRRFNIVLEQEPHNLSDIES